MQNELANLKFGQYFCDLSDEVRRCLRIGDYKLSIENYLELVRMLDNFAEVIYYLLKHLITSIYNYFA